jgi:hypothetical protein
MEGISELPTKKTMKYKELQRGMKKMKTVWVKRCWIYRYLPIGFIGIYQYTSVHKCSPLISKWVDEPFP